MNRAMLAGIFTLCICVSTACGTMSGETAVDKNHTNQTSTTFFQGLSTHKLKVVLHPDASVKQAMPNIKPPKQRVIVYLPVYPGAKSIPWVGGIGDAGTPMDKNLLDGTVYFEAKDSVAKVQAWYVDEFKKLGYTIDSRGSDGEDGKTTTTYVAFTKDDPTGTPTKDPDISLGFDTQRLNGETIFKLLASYIVRPSRPLPKV